MAILGLEQPAVSRHLAYLHRAGLVVVRRAGLWCHYSVAPAQGPFHVKLLECLACCFQEVPQIQTDQARARQLRKAGGCCPDSAQPRTVEEASKTRKPRSCCP